MLLGIVLFVGFELGSSDGSVLIVGSCEGSLVGRADIDGSPVGL